MNQNYTAILRGDEARGDSFLSDPDVINIHDIKLKVAREKHLFHGLVRFIKLIDPVTPESGLNEILRVCLQTSFKTSCQDKKIIH